MWTPFLFLACTGTAGDSSPVTDSSPVVTDTHTHPDSAPSERRVVVTLDGAQVAGVSVFQGGTDERHETDAAGEALVPLDLSVIGELWIVAAHPEARAGAAQIYPDSDDDSPLTIELTRFSTTDNPDYGFENPGTPDDRDDTGRCAHCHLTINESWHDSPHRTSASNPWVQDVYAGAAAAWADEQACADAGGSWWEGLAPGTTDPQDRCYLGHGTLPDLNTDCGTESSCDGVAAETGLCADCHAPAMDGVLGGRDLLAATGHAYDYGVSCDLCHKVDAVDLAAQAPGVAGRLQVLRPADESTSLLLGPWQPLTFGPFDDVPSIRMGGVQRDHYANGELCAGCHQLDQPVLVPGAELDAERWPDGLLPIHSTWQEWSDGPLADAAPCQSCHMPPDPTVGNAADLGNVIDDVEPGVVAGWYRDPGTVREHSWVGPRTPDSGMLELAATVDVSGTVTDGTLTVQATAANVGPAHAIPTGEPLRHLLLRVDARCDGVPLSPTGGDALPAWAGALDTQDAQGDWALWPGAAEGEQLVVVSQTGDFHDYTGTGPFGDGRFDLTERGLPVEHVIGVRTITQVAEARVTVDAPLPTGDVAYRLPADSWPDDDQAPVALAGRPGFAFAKVLADADGVLMVPHHRAVDVVSDNRILPGTSWTSTHLFAATCEEPTLHATLLYRSAPVDLAQERGWTRTDRVMDQVTR